MPQFYALDTYPAQPVEEVNKIGTFYREYDVAVFHTTCTATHSSLPPEGFNSYAQIGYALEASSPHDIFVIGGTINNQGKKDVSESLPSTSLLETLFDPAPNGLDANHLSFPKDMFFSTNQPDGGFLRYRPARSRTHRPVRQLLHSGLQEIDPR